jgi:DNA-binding NtrC family response regulator
MARADCDDPGFKRISLREGSFKMIWIADLRPRMDCDVTRQHAQTVLCVDDEPGILAALRRVFRPYGYRVLTASSGEDALELLEHEGVSVVISDMSMPGMDGPAFLEVVRRRWPDTVRLLLTGHSGVDAGIGAGADGALFGYIAKPWDEDVILVTIRHAFARHTRATNDQ